MNNRIITALLIILIVAVNMIVVQRGWNLASEYPFKRLLLENTIHFTSVFNDIPEGYGGKIIEVNGEKFKNAADLLTRIADKKVTTITYKTGSYIRKRPVEGYNFNNDVFAFIVFILLCGNIHCIWGAVIRTVYPENETSKNFSQFAVGMGCYFLSLALFFVFHNGVVLLAASALYIVYSIVKISLMISPLNNKIRLVRGFSVVLLVLLSVSVYCSLIFHLADVLVFLNSLIVLSFIGSVVIIISRLMRNRNISRKTAVLLISSGVISIFIPFVMIALSFKKDVHLPVSFYASLTIFLPMIVGNSIASENIRNTFALRRRYLLRIFIDISVSLIFAVSIFMVLRSGIRSDLLLGIEFVTVAGFVLLLFVRKEFITAIRLYDNATKEHFTRCLRKISEITASPGELTVRIKSIFAIIAEATGLNDIIVELFEKEIIRKIDEIPGYLEYCPDTRTQQYIIKHRNIIYRNSLFTGCIYDYVNQENALRPFSELVIPIESEGAVIGIMQAGSKSGGRGLAEDELRFLNSVSIILYQLIENEILYREYSEKRNYEKEIDIASYIQMRLFPKNIPSGRGFSAWFYSRPYVKVTGDYIDFFTIDENKTMIAIGDVAGHGLSAATILAVIGHVISACIDEKRDLADIFLELNNFFTKRYRGNQILTLFMMVYDRSTGSAEYINAGHCIPVIMREGEIIDNYFSARSQIIGADSSWPYESTTVPLHAKDEIMLFTDGITEIQKERSEDNIGDIFIIDVMKNKSIDSMEGKIEFIGRHLETFPRKSIKDDITILGLQID